METDTKGQKIKQFFKENAYFLVVGGVVLLFAVLIIVASATSEVKDNKVPVTDNNVPVTSTITYYLPVLNASITKNYSATELQYNSTLKQWEAHKSIDFAASAGSEVRAITSGKVIDVYNNYLEGTVVKIEHDNGLVSEYGSLDEDVKVKEGDTVQSNAIIGFVSASANAEANEGSHLHFTMYDEAGKKIDPAGYLSLGNK